jgi:hypothetical protein
MKTKSLFEDNFGKLKVTSDEKCLRIKKTSILFAKNEMEIGQKTDSKSLQRGAQNALKNC